MSSYHTLFVWGQPSVIYESTIDSRNSLRVISLISVLDYIVYVQDDFPYVNTESQKV